MRVLLAVFLVFLVSGSETTKVYNGQLTYRPKGSPDASYVITPRLEQNFWTSEKVVFVNIDGHDVLEGTLGYDNTGAFFGMYDGKKVNASCADGFQQIKCQLFIDGEFVGNF